MSAERWLLVAMIAYQALLAASLGANFVFTAVALAAALFANFNRRRLLTKQLEWGLVAGWFTCLLGITLAGVRVSLVETILEPGTWLLILAQTAIGWQIIRLYQVESSEKSEERNWLGIAIFALFCLFARAGTQQTIVSVPWILGAMCGVVGRQMLRYPRGSFSAIPAASFVASMIGLTMYLDDLCLKGVPRMQSWFASTVRANAGHASVVRSYVRQATLSSVSFEMITDPKSQALRVRCDRMPGYLRSMAFDTFIGDEWVMARRRGIRHFGAGRQLAPVPPPADLPDLTPGSITHAIPEKFGGPWLCMEVLNDSKRGEAYFLPLETDLVGCKEEKGIWVDEHQILFRGISTKRPYQLYVGMLPQSDTLNEKERETLLSLPKQIDPRALALQSRVFNAGDSVPIKIRKLEQYFRENYRYSLGGFHLPKETDPISHFLLEKPEAHCEFFATAAAVLLRAAGVPCRYVIGYTVTKNTWSDSTTWIAYNRDAHAWVEAFDDATQSWAIVEATPGVNIPKSLRIRERLDTNLATAATAEESAERVEDEWAWGRWWVLSPGRMEWLFKGGSLLLLLVVGGWYAWQHWQYSLLGEMEWQRALWRKQLKELDRRVGRHSLERRPAETLHLFAERLRQHGNHVAWLHQAADWYEAYAAKLYGAEYAAETVLPPPPHARKVTH